MKTIEEKNKVIAEFMGWREQKDPTERFFGDWFDKHERKTDGIRTPLLFHTDWNWLMPCVKKIGKIDIDEPYEIEEWIELRDNLIYGDIEESFNQAFQFIEWYNEQK